MNLNNGCIKNMPHYLNNTHELCLVNRFISQCYGWAISLRTPKVRHSSYQTLHYFYTFNPCINRRHQTRQKTSKCDIQCTWTSHFDVFWDQYFGFRCTRTQNPHVHDLHSKEKRLVVSSVRLIILQLIISKNQPNCENNNYSSKLIGLD